MTKLSEEKESLWIIPISLVIWAAHFLLSYITAAIWCAKVAGVGGSLKTVQVIIAVYSIIALIGVGVFGWKGYNMHRFRDGSRPHDQDTPASRHRFLGYAALLVSALSAVAILYETLVIFFVERCY